MKISQIGLVGAPRRVFRSDSSHGRLPGGPVWQCLPGRRAAEPEASPGASAAVTDSGGGGTDRVRRRRPPGSTPRACRPARHSARSSGGRERDPAGRPTSGTTSAIRWSRDGAGRRVRARTGTDARREPTVQCCRIRPAAPRAALRRTLAGSSARERQRQAPAAHDTDVLELGTVLGVRQLAVLTEQAQPVQRPAGKRRAARGNRRRRARGRRPSGRPPGSRWDDRVGCPGSSDRCRRRRACGPARRRRVPAGTLSAVSARSERSAGTRATPLTAAASVTADTALHSPAPADFRQAESAQHAERNHQRHAGSTGRGSGPLPRRSRRSRCPRRTGSRPSAAGRRRVPRAVPARRGGAPTPRPPAPPG